MAAASEVAAAPIAPFVSWVEIHGLSEPLEVLSGPPVVLGTCIAADGLRGWTMDLHAASGSVDVETLDGLRVAVPAANVRLIEPVSPADGGFDALWPAYPSATGASVPSASSATASMAAEEMLAVAGTVATALRVDGCCLLHVPVDSAVHAENMRSARERGDFCLPEAELESAYLGERADSKVAWLLGDAGNPAQVREAASWERLAEGGHGGAAVGGVREVAAVARALASLDGALDFVPWGYSGSMLLRAALEDGERSRLGQPSLQEVAAVVPEVVGRHLDFLQRRRLCILYVLESAGASVELVPSGSAESGEALPGVHLPMSRGRMLIFRSDRFSFAYEPRFSSPSGELCLQAWLLEAPLVLRLDGLGHGVEEGGYLDELAPMAFGGVAPPQASNKQVHIMSAACTFPGSGSGLWGFWNVVSNMVDSFIEMPRTRWDIDVYYDDDASQFGTGKSSTKHAGLLSFEEFVCFDNKFFGISEVKAYMLAPPIRCLMESSYVCLHLAGHTRETLRGAGTAIYVGDVGTEWDAFIGLAPSSAFVDDPDVWAKSTTTHSISSAGQLAMTFGTVGPVMCIDTACSSSLVTASLIHGSLRKHDARMDWSEGLSMGFIGLISPFTFIGLSGAGMLGRCGRCMTFDQTANGYNRGEGTGGLLERVTDDHEEASMRLGNYISSFINQDGRSASLTAPNGPSQQAVMRNSMKLENIAVEDVIGQENHGTGTALGDPIEVGSVRSVFRKHPTAITITSGKTHTGHLESTAGSVGLLKSLLQLLHAGCAPNCHLYQLNAHMDTAGFPALFPTELIDTRFECSLTGLNGFGFGGTNCRSELWAKTCRGPRSRPTRMVKERHREGQPWELGGRVEALDAADCITEKCPRCLAPMCWRCGQARPGEVAGRHACSTIRKDFTAYDYCSDCFVGNYRYGSSAPSSARLPNGRGVFLVGSWSSWSAMEEMRELSEGLFVGEIRLGSAGFEHFHFVVDEDQEQCIVPVGPKASADARIVGPLPFWRAWSWLIDGRADGSPEGAMYEVRFEWTEMSKAIAWRRLNRRTKAMAPQHSFSVVGSFSGWRPAEMRRSAVERSTWEFRAEFGPQGVEEAYFLRDGDAEQMIYPLVAAPADPAVPVLGPGPADERKGWRCHGAPGTPLVARLRLLRGRGGGGGGFEVEFRKEEEGDEAVAAWRSPSASSRDLYHLVGSFGDWRPEAALALEASGGASRPGLFTGRFFLGASWREEFQILVNLNWSQVLHPSSPGVAPGQALLEGPAPAGPDAHWAVEGPPGQLVEVALDFGAEDSYQMVTCYAVEEPALDDWGDVAASGAAVSAGEE